MEKNLSGVKTDYLYDLASHVITAFQSAGTWQRGEIYASGWHLGTYYPNATYFSFTDWLGTEHYRTDNLGFLSQTCYNLPFGDGQTCNGTDSSPLHFTGKERDSESGLDYFGARYYASTAARFASPDPVKITTSRIVDPQRLNTYSYVRNSPLTFIDTDGRDLLLIVTANAVSTSTVRKYTGAEMKANPDLKQQSQSVPTYRVLMKNDSGSIYETQVTRDSIRNGSVAETRGNYSTGNETPPGTYSGQAREGGTLGFRISLSDEPGRGEVSGPQGTRQGLAIHIGSCASEGCMCLTGGAEGRQQFQAQITALQAEDQHAGLGEAITVTVVDRNVPTETTPLPDKIEAVKPE